MGIAHRGLALPRVPARSPRARTRGYHQSPLPRLSDLTVGENVWGLRHRPTGSHPWLPPVAALRLTQCAMESGARNHELNMVPRVPRVPARSARAPTRGYPQSPLPRLSDRMVGANVWGLRHRPTGSHPWLPPVAAPRLAQCAMERGARNHGKNRCLARIPLAHPLGSSVKPQSQSVDRRETFPRG